MEGEEAIYLIVGAVGAIKASKVACIKVALIIGKNAVTNTSLTWSRKRPFLQTIAAKVHQLMFFSTLVPLFLAYEVPQIGMQE